MVRLYKNMFPIPHLCHSACAVGYDIEKGLTWPLWLVGTISVSLGRPICPGVHVRGAHRAGKNQRTASWPPPANADSDWVVKLIDVYPDEVAGQEQMGRAITGSGHFPWALSREPGKCGSQSKRIRRWSIVLNRPQRTMSFYRTPHHGSGAVKLVPVMHAIRRRLYQKSGQARAITRKPRSGFTISRAGELCGIAGSDRAVDREFSLPRLRQLTSDFARPIPMCRSSSSGC